MSAVIEGGRATARGRGHVLVQARLLEIQLKGLELREAAALQRRGELKCRICSRSAIVAAGRVVCTTDPSHGASRERYARAVKEFGDLARMREIHGLARGEEPQRFWKMVKTGVLQTREQTREHGRRLGSRAEAAASRRLARRLGGRS